ncbi:Rho-type GTPase activating protein Rga1 [Vanrija albida]|uniref:Rho-type GTPase activating protein Rga1 n=1 Tax=Vanrija albida TaxID=181172 RepID=A0ABR3PU83_9TREE
MSSPRFNAAPPRRDSAGVVGLAAQTANLNLVTRQPSSDSLGRPSMSRRPSAASSAHSQSAQTGFQQPHSPASVSSSGHPWVTAREGTDSHWTSSPQATTSALPPAGPAAPQPIRKMSNLPRISMPEDSDGGRSAPQVSSPLVSPAPPFIQPPARSASSPDPRPGSNNASPVTSPIEHRPGGQSFGGPSGDYPQPQQRGHTYPNTATTSSSHGEGALTPRRSDTPTSIGSSTHGPQAGATTASTASGGKPQTEKSRSGSVTYCAKCGLAVRGQFVRALQHVYHLECFRCRDCDKVVAQKFFPVDDGEGGQYPLCERDYFARLDLICAKCDQALRSSYITACGEKYHVEHFSCSVCDTVFGPVDSYYEHGGKVYCHYHYSISFANKCVGCETAILKQFVEINRNGRDECWHPECYMIHKFWNVRLASRNFTTPATATPTQSTVSLLEMSSAGAGGLQPMSAQSPNVGSTSTSPGWGTDMTAEELKERQIAMELKVSQIWLVLSGFEETSAACIGEMLRVVNERRLLDVILLAEKFILHVETLFAVIDDIEAQFALAGVKGMSHAREAKQLCRKLVNFFSMLSQISPTGGPIPNMQDLLTQVTQLAHYLKILIRIALTGAIKLDREQGNPKALIDALARLHLLSLDNADPTVRKRGEHPEPTGNIPPWTGNETPEEMATRSFDSLTRHPDGFIPSTRGIAYGYRSLAPESTGETTLRGPQDDHFVPNDGCARCNGPIEDDCVRQGMFNRWHSACVECKNCKDKASNTPDADKLIAPPPTSGLTDDESHEGGSTHKEHVSKPHRRSPPRVGDFSYEPAVVKYSPPETIWCNLHRSASAIAGFESVSRLEQFAFLLHVALRRLYLHFREHHGIPSAVTYIEAGHDVKRVKSVTLDRKLSSTARVPQRLTVVESPSGRMADANGQVVPARDAAPTPTITTPTVGVEQVIRPPFARNNTSVRIISETAPVTTQPLASESQDVLTPLNTSTPRRVQEDDAITLSDIPMLAKQSIHPRSPHDSTPLLAELTPLQALILRHFSLILLQKTAGLSEHANADEIIDLLDARKNQWWNKLFKNNAKKDQKKKGIFGVPLEILVDRTGSDSQQGANPNVTLRVPEFIEEIISTMRQMDMAIEGIFRKNGNIRKLQLIAEQLDKDYSSVTLSEENPVQLAALLKRFLREIPDPLLTFRLHKLFCSAATLPSHEERIRSLHLLLTLLPKANRDTLEVLFVFLRWVASFSYKDEETGSRMDMANLATVITPSILYAKGGNAARDESFIGIQAVQQLLENQDELYRVPPELMFVLHENVADIFSKEIDLPPKEIHKHCAKYLQHRGQTTFQHRPSVAAGMHGDLSARPEMPASAGALRAGATASNGSLPTSWGAGPSGAGPSGSGTIAMPTPQINGQPASPGFVPPGHAPSPGPPPNWRGPFQGAASNGSRQSSRGSGPPSPGIAPDDRRSFQMERDRSRERAWTPSNHPDNRQ